MKKRGQIYILVALIIGIVVFLVVSRTNIFIQEELATDIEAIGENYFIESNKLINSLIGAKRENISDILSQATTEFVYQYAKTRDPQFGLVYVFTNQEDAVIENFLNSRVIIEAQSGEREGLTSPEAEYELGTIELGGAKIGQGYTYRQIQTEFPDLFDQVLKEKFKGEVNAKQGDQIILDVDGAQYYFIVGDTVELNAVARRTEGDQIQVFQTRDKKDGAA